MVGDKLEEESVAREFRALRTEVRNLGCILR